MSEDQLYDSIIFELKLISRIKKNDKLTTTGEKIGIDNSGTLQPVVRYYYGEGRDATMSHIEKLSEQIFTFLNKTIKVARQNKNIVFSVHQKSDINNQLRQLWLELSGAIKGLENLKITYSNDASTESRIEQVIDKFKGYIADITGSLYLTQGNGATAIKQEDMV